MEKQRIKRTSGFIKGLLVLVSIFTLFSFNISAYETKNSNIKVEKEEEPLIFNAIENQKMFINTDILFEVFIPDSVPEEININIEDQENKKGIVFKSMKKFENYTGDKGTKIQIWYSFEEEGSYTIPPLKASFIKDGKDYPFLIPFSLVKLTEDPTKMSPRIVIRFSNGVIIKSDDIKENEEPIFTYDVNKKMYFTVYLQYAKQLTYFDFELPKDSLYKQVKTYEITDINYIEKSISNRLVPVADFEWTVLQEGLYPIPKFKLTAIDYTGYKNHLMLPEFKIKIEKNNNIKTSQKEDLIFTDAFSTPVIEKPVSKIKKITNEDCEELAMLHKKERNAFFSKSKYKKQRVALEESLGLPSSSGTTSNFTSPFIITVLIIAIVFFILLLILAVKKKNSLRIFVHIFIIFLLTVLLTFSFYKRSIKYGICKGTVIYSIPEKDALSFSEIAPGNMVLITESINNWYYIQLGEMSGWSSKENIIVIK